MEKNIDNGATMPERLKNYEVNLFKRENDIDKKIVGGKLLLWTASKEITFVQNAPRGPRSVEIGRTAHARAVRLQSGYYSVRFRFGAGERQLNYQLIAEMREIGKMAAEDAEREEKKRKEAAK